MKKYASGVPDLVRAPIEALDTDDPQSDLEMHAID